MTPPTAILTEELRARLFAFILSRVRSHDVADDLTQETLVRTARSLGQTEIANLEGWLFRVARNVVADHFRGSKEQVQWQEHEHAEPIREDALTKEEAALREQLALYVRAVVEDLPEPHREALLLTEYQGLTQAQLAERLGITHSAAKSRVQRARNEVKRTIEQCCRVATDFYGQVTDMMPRDRAVCDC
jgi:RNA polymerase sigma-70 factor (ECF subfamily)